MPAKVTLTVTEGMLPRPEYVFDERTTCLIGRADGCDPLVPDTKDYQSVLRRHCLLDINPPDIRVRNVGSTVQFSAADAAEN